MPSIAQEYQDPVSSKKRRREGDEEIQVKLSSPRSPRPNRECPSKESPLSSSRRFIGIKACKRQRFEIAAPPQPATHHFLRTPPHQKENDRDSYFPQSHQEKPKEEKKKDLSPCHICHRRPTVVQELDNFANCEGCGGRTCWICVRECAGFQRGVEGVFTPGEASGDGDAGPQWGMGVGEELEDSYANESGNGHRRMVCSRCCVEKGIEGEVWCLGCLRSEGDG